MNLSLTQQEKEDLMISISCRLGFIETGQVAMRATDAINSKQHHLIKPLSREQRELVMRLEDLFQKLIDG